MNIFAIIILTGLTAFIPILVGVLIYDSVCQSKEKLTIVSTTVITIGTIITLPTLMICGLTNCETEYVANYMSQKVTIEESLKNDNLSGYERASLVTKSAELNGELAERKVRFNRWYNIYSDNTIYDNVEPINFGIGGDEDED